MADNLSIDRRTSALLVMDFQTLTVEAFLLRNGAPASGLRMNIHVLVSDLVMNLRNRVMRSLQRLKYTKQSVS